jgi:hypothetical protein
MSVARVSATLLWAIARVHRDSLQLRIPAYDLRFGSPAARIALVNGEDPDTVIDRELPAAVAFSQLSRKYMLYR